MKSLLLLALFSVTVAAAHASDLYFRVVDPASNAIRPTRNGMMGEGTVSLEKNIGGLVREVKISGDKASPSATIRYTRKEGKEIVFEKKIAMAQTVTDAAGRSIASGDLLVLPAGLEKLPPDWTKAGPAKYALVRVP